jgi:hypothetical protein
MGCSMSSETKTAKPWFGLDGRIPFYIQTMSWMFVTIFVVSLIEPWFLKFIDWYWPWVKNQ